jgi:hypothetical protein
MRKWNEQHTLAVIKNTLSFGPEVKTDIPTEKKFPLRVALWNQRQTLNGVSGGNMILCTVSAPVRAAAAMAPGPGHSLSFTNMALFTGQNTNRNGDSMASTAILVWKSDVAQVVLAAR